VIRLRSRGTLVLLYHRVADLPSDPWSLAVTPRHFAEHLEVLCAMARPVPLRVAAEGRAPRRAVAVTFDDGYADNLHAAKPLLERRGVPATVFVTTGGLDDGRELWWDELERVAPEERAYRDLWQRLRALAPAERRQTLDALLERAGLDAAPRLTHRTLTADELVALTAGGLVEAGAHSVSHSRLADLDADGQRAEVAGSRARLAEILGRPPAAFSYPFGGPADYSEETVRLVREAGFSHACANAPGLARRGADPFRIPRVYVTDCDGGGFAERLAGWLRHGGTP